VPEAPAGARRLELDVDALAALLEGVAELTPRAPTAREVARAARSFAQAQMRR